MFPSDKRNNWTCQKIQRKLEIISRSVNQHCFVVERRGSSWIVHKKLIAVNNDCEFQLYQSQCSFFKLSVSVACNFRAVICNRLSKISSLAFNPRSKHFSLSARWFSMHYAHWWICLTHCAN